MSFENRALSVIGLGKIVVENARKCSPGQVLLSRTENCDLWIPLPKASGTSKENYDGDGNCQAIGFCN